MDLFGWKYNNYSGMRRYFRALFSCPVNLRDSAKNIEILHYLIYLQLVIWWTDRKHFGSIFWTTEISNHPAQLDRDGGVAAERRSSKPRPGPRPAS